MECVEAKAFKTSLGRPEMIVKSSSTNQQQQQKHVVFHEDEEVFKTSSWGSSNNNTNGIAINGDETFVDEFLDFSNEETWVIVKEEEGYETVGDKDTEMMKTVFSQEKSLKNDFVSVLASELSVPTDDLADLEWLSHFVEDSFSEEFSQTQYNDGNPTVLTEPKTENQDKTEPEKKQPEFIKTESMETMGFGISLQQPPPPTAATTVPGKARSKRSTGGRVWSLGYSSLTETSSSSSTTTASSTSSSSSGLIFNNNNTRTPDCCYDSLRKPPVIRQKKRVFVNEDDNGGCGGARVIRTQCSHCGVQKTPQWRTGPLGAKTLCNACGVRYKSGRLLPEYRPASSPTFSRDVHSNSHRRVLEMREKKEGAPEPGFTPAPAAQLLNG